MAHWVDLDEKPLQKWRSVARLVLFAVLLGAAVFLLRDDRLNPEPQAPAPPTEACRALRPEDRLTDLARLNKVDAQSQLDAALRCDPTFKGKVEDALRDDRWLVLVLGAVFVLAFGHLQYRLRWRAATWFGLVFAVAYVAAAVTQWVELDDAINARALSPSLTVMVADASSSGALGGVTAASGSRTGTAPALVTSVVCGRTVTCVPSGRSTQPPSGSSTDAPPATGRAASDVDTSHPVGMNTTSSVSSTSPRFTSSPVK
jgi:hypothetical protein